MWRFWIDTGGTFTDCLAKDPDGNEHRLKILSCSALRGSLLERKGPKQWVVDLPIEVAEGTLDGYGFRYFGEAIGESAIAEWSEASSTLTLESEIEGASPGTLFEIQSPEEPPIFAARVLAGCKLNERLPPISMRLATTRGTNALLEEKGARVAFVVTKGFGDLLRIGNQQRPRLFELGIRKPDPLHAFVFECDGRLDKDGVELEPLDLEEIDRIAQDCIDAGVGSIAIALLHSYVSPRHEELVAERFERRGLRFVSRSSALSPFAKIVPRAETALVNAYLSPIMDSYLDSVQSCLSDGSFKVMTSAGGLGARESYRPKDSLLSGPAGGAVGSASVGERVGLRKSIAFDMGGTSTDVSRYDGKLDYRFEQTIGSARVFAPGIRIETVAAGGGSICWFDGSALRVGPQSAGAMPGPACYGTGGPLTITDVDLLLGRLDAGHFNIPVFPGDAEIRLAELVREVERETGECVERDRLLKDLLGIANERMADAIRGISVREGYDPKDYALVAFGGAGGLHACGIADILGMDTIVYPADSGLLSAYGLRQARIERFAERQVMQRLADAAPALEAMFAALVEQARVALAGEGVNDSEVASQKVEMRFEGQEAVLSVDWKSGIDLGDTFSNSYARQFGFVPVDRFMEVVALRVVVAARALPLVGESVSAAEKAPLSGEKRFFARSELGEGATLHGPCVIQDGYGTLFLEDGWRSVVGGFGTMRLERMRGPENRGPARSNSVSDAAALELYANRFLSIVDEMGALLERCAFSTNVKERKDFSCALLDREGRLIANAPHIPVHLGALGVCVRSVVETMRLSEGDVAISNHPAFGGSHLPDVTLIAPVHSAEGHLLGYVANRAHHAEIGGIAPGSMPPNAARLSEEGVVIPPTLLVRAGVADWVSIEAALTENAYPTRRIEENLADLAAQLASLRVGSRAVSEMAERNGRGTVTRFMDLLRERAAKALAKAMESLPSRVFEAEEILDNGAAIKVLIAKEGPMWKIDFAGSAGVQRSNYNATPAIVTSATIYALRLLANVDIPLNEGFLDVVDIRIPEKSFLSPEFAALDVDCPPVVAGNVEVSQRIVDTLIKALGIAACSQGTMNNVIFGNRNFSYYETICGGEGATRDRAGASGMHTHMTNTAITDPEIMEKRLPVRLEEFSLRQGSGGAGAQPGGLGVTRRIRFLEDVELSLLMQHRVVAPFGIEGGSDGARGEQWLVARSGERTSVDGNASLSVKAGCAVEIRTPGGGGVGDV